MNPSLGLLLPLLMGQPVPGCAPAVPTSAGCASCGPTVPAYLLAAPRPGTRQPCPPAGPPAPVLAVKAILPEKAVLTLDPSEQGYATGAVFGFRPGYSYRLKVSNLPAGNPGDALGGTLEVRGSIVPRPNMKYMEFAAALYVTKTDLAKALAGGVVTKVIYLEDPEKAIPMEEKANEPVEVAADSERDAIDTADASGRIVAILRLGDRAPTRDELARAYIDGTVLLPGQRHLAAPAAPAHFGCSGIPLYDPILGPKPMKEECFLNGGDSGLSVGIGPGNRLGGLDPTDVAAEYTRGTKREATVSNVVCLCSPRFVIRRTDTAPGGLAGSVYAAATNQVFSRSVFRHRAFTEELLERERTLGLIARQRPGGLDTLTVLHALGTTMKTQALGMTEGVQVVAVVVQPDEITSFPTRLLLTKSVDPAGPYKPGDVVTITLKYANNTRQPITDLVISDSLSGRLEFVDGSAAASRPSNITTADNEVGSKVVRFDIPGPIPPAGTGVVVFQVKVR